jgi:itaconyl-CoA hydratase
VGQRFQHRPGLTVSQQDNKEEALATLNQAMVHYDAAYAAATEWGDPLVVSTLTLRAVIGMTSKTFARRRPLTAFDDIALTHPVFGGDTLYAESEIAATADDPEEPSAGRLTVITRGVNQRGQTVCAMTYSALVEREERDHGAVLEESPRFASHREVSPGVFREQAGLPFEALVPGETFEHRPGKTFTLDESVRHALQVLEQSPRVVEFDRRQRAIDELAVLGAVTALSTKTLGRVVANLGWKNVRLPLPVRDGDTVYAESTVLDTRASHSRPTQGVVHVATRGINQAAALVCSYERWLLVYRAGHGPYDRAGY